MRTHQATLDRIEQRFGVPPQILIAIWGLETNYGADTSGKYSIVRSLATLAYDCRRSEFFTGHLLDALRIVERGDLTLAQLRGGWAGEIGQTQFLPSGYYQVRRRFRRRRAPRSRAQRARHAGLHRQLPEGPRLAGRARAGSRARPTTPCSRTGTEPRSTSAPSP